MLDVILLSECFLAAYSPPTCSVESCDYVKEHRRVSVVLAVPRARRKPEYREGRNWRVFDTESFLADIACVDWHSVVRRGDPCGEQWEKFSCKITKILDTHAPKRVFRVHNPNKPPLADETIELLSQRRAAKANGDPDYDRLNTLVKRAIRRDQRRDIEEKIKNSAPSEMFRQLKNVIAPKRGPPTLPDLSSDDLNEYFTSVGTETRNEVLTKFRQTGRKTLKTRLPRVNAGGMRISPVTLKQLRRVLFSTPNKQSHIEGDIPIKILKKTFNIIGRYLLRIINLSFVSEKVPGIAGNLLL